MSYHDLNLKKCNFYQFTVDEGSLSGTRIITTSKDMSTYALILKGRGCVKLWVEGHKKKFSRGSLQKFHNKLNIKQLLL